jgi:peptidoglycan/LPS O-acetylase OafA/YrhL
MSITHESFQRARHFGSLDGLRAASIIAVVLHHTAGDALPHSRLVRKGAEGVTLFFAISGFLITTLLLREQERHGTIDLGAFYARRSLRIFPLYYAVLLLYGGLVYALERHTAVGRQFFENLPYFATYTSNWFVPLEGRVIFYFAWSLAAEEQFYLVWPPLLRVLPSRVAALWVVGALSLGIVAVELTHVAGAAVPKGLLWLVLKLPLSILLGVCAALALHGPRGFALLAGPLGHKYASALWLVLAVASLALGGVPRFVPHVLLTALVVACVIRPDHALARLLALRPLAYVGTVSYGLYLLHVLVKNALAKVLTRFVGEPVWWLLFPGTLLVATGVAALSFRYFESPILRLKKRYER